MRLAYGRHLQRGYLSLQRDPHRDNAAYDAGTLPRTLGETVPLRQQIALEVNAVVNIDRAGIEALGSRRSGRAAA